MRSRSYLYPFIALLLVVLNYYFLKVAQIVILSCFRPLSIAILVKNGDFSRFQLGRTDGRTDTPSYRDARTHLKAKRNKKYQKSAAAARHTAYVRSNGRRDGRTNKQLVEQMKTTSSKNAAQICMRQIKFQFRALLSI